MSAPARVFLVGMMGSGKTTVGHLVAERLGRRYVDSDDQVVERTGRTSSELLESLGRDTLHREEDAALREVAGLAEPVVASVAAGSVLRPENRMLLQRSGFVVWLRVGVPELVRRVKDRGKPLPVGDLEHGLGAFARERDPFYAEVADLVVDAESLAPEQAAERIVAALGRPGTRDPER